MLSWIFFIDLEEIMRYEGPIFRPFSEANSYLLQCTIGCSHNSCTFCGMYMGKKYRVRPLEDIFYNIELAGKEYGDVDKVFLIDGDAVAMETGSLLAVLEKLFATFPYLRHVGSYVGPQSTLDKGAEDLRRLCEAGLTKVYLGVESGSDRILQKVNKGVGADEMLRAGQMLVQAGMNLSSMVLLGLSGEKHASEEHARATAAITNAMKPRYLAALTVTPVPGTVLHRQVERGEFHILPPLETLKEMRMMIDGLTIDGLRFVGVHASNYLPVNGTLQKDKNEMLSVIDNVLASGDERLMRSEGERGL